MTDYGTSICERHFPANALCYAIGPLSSHRRITSNRLVLALTLSLYFATSTDNVTLDRSVYFYNHCTEVQPLRFLHLVTDQAP